MITRKQHRDRELSRRTREDRLLGRAIDRSARPVKPIPPGRAEDKEWLTGHARRLGDGSLTWQAGDRFPKEWL